jgi:hypothetical protein
MNVLEIIICIIFILSIVFALIGLGCLLIKVFILNPIANFYVDKKTNKLQWKCEETRRTKEARLNGEDPIDEYILSYKVLNSELPTFSKMFGNNTWSYFEQDKPFVFKSENEFKEFVSKFKTIGDIKNYYKGLEDTIIWYEP